MTGKIQKGHMFFLNSTWLKPGAAVKIFNNALKVKYLQIRFTLFLQKNNPTPYEIVRFIRPRL